MDRISSRVIDLLDIDTRRSLGIYKKLPKSNFCPRPIPPTSFRWYPDQNKLLFINFDLSLDLYMWEVFRGIARVEDTEEWYYHPGAVDELWMGNDKYHRHVILPEMIGLRFMFAGIPEIILDTPKDESLDH